VDLFGTPPLIFRETEGLHGLAVTFAEVNHRLIPIGVDGNSGQPLDEISAYAWNVEQRLEIIRGHGKSMSEWGWKCEAGGGKEKTSVAATP
jgi:hypothetical protein